MHIQVITFQLQDMSVEAYHGACDSLADTWAQIPGLISKIWLEDVDANTYGGVYTWESREAMEQYLQSELFSGIAASPNFINLTSQDFSIIDAPTRVTRGNVTVPA
jgi:quinol monooxygenase YgiN